MAKTTKKDALQTVEKGMSVTVSAPKLMVATFRIQGDAPLVQLRFSEKAKEALRQSMLAGNTSRSKKNRAPRDFDADYANALYESPEGWRGINASAFRNAMISVCRLVGYKMVLAKLSVFVLADGYDAKEPSIPLVRVYGEPKKVEHIVRNANGMPDIRVRGMWMPNWYADVRVRYDRDQFTPQDIANLMTRVGAQAGIGEGRPDSKNSAGMGWGTFVPVDFSEVAFSKTA